MSRSFVDILFILLCSTVVMLSQSLQIGSLDVAPAKVGGGGISAICADDVQLLVVHKDGLEIVDVTGQHKRQVQNMEELAGVIRDPHGVILVAGSEDVSHQRVMHVWSECRNSGWVVKLGAVPEGKDALKE